MNAAQVVHEMKPSFSKSFFVHSKRPKRRMTSSQMEFDFEECSVEGIKTYLDYVHMLDVPPLSVTLLLDVLKFLHFQERFDFVENFLQ